MERIGFLYIRNVDAIRYDIVRHVDTGAIYFQYEGTNLGIHLPKNVLAGADICRPIHIVLDKSPTHEQYVERFRQPYMPDYIWINDERVENNGVIPWMQLRNHIPKFALRNL